MGKSKYASGELAICPMVASKQSHDPYKDICKITKSFLVTKLIFSKV